VLFVANPSAEFRVIRVFRGDPPMPWKTTPVHFIGFEGTTTSGIIEFGVVTLRVLFPCRENRHGLVLASIWFFPTVAWWH
jgi:hypothetical protein